MKYQNYIYSKTLDYYLILPMKTGTVTASWIFTYFDFFTYSRKFDENNDFVELPNPALTMVHSFYLPPEVSNPKIIMTTRNPYDRFLSKFIFSWLKSEPPSVSDFDSYVIKSIENDSPIFNYPDNINPTYVIHLENAYEDYMKIPFVADSNISKSGILKEVLGKKMNESRLKLNKDEFLTQKNKELIYSYMKNQFEPFGYEK